MPGDEFALHESGLLCREDHEMMDREDNNNLAISVKEEEFRWDKGCYLVDCSHCWTNVSE